MVNGNARQFARLIVLVGGLCGPLPGCASGPGDVVYGATVGPNIRMSIVTLPRAWATVLPLGDSHVEGILNKIEPADTWLAVGEDGTGKWRRFLLEELDVRGIPYPFRNFFVGARVSSSPDLPVGQIHHQGTAGQRMGGASGSMADLFPTVWATASNRAPGMVLIGGTNDMQAWLNSHASDYAGAAAAANAALLEMLTVVWAQAPTLVIGYVTPPASNSHYRDADLFLPLARATIATRQAAGQKVYIVYDATTYLRESVNEAVGTNSDLFCQDSIHLNLFGDRKLAGGILGGMLTSPYEN